MKPRTTQTVLGGIGAAVSVAFLAVIGWGRVRNVDVPEPRTWDHQPVIAIDDSTGRIDREALHEALERWRDHNHIAGCCSADPAVADVVIHIDNTLDTDPGTCGAGDVDDTKCPAQTWGVTHCTAERDGGTVRCDVRLHPRAGAVAIGHELGHVFGFEHPPNAPTGHILNAHRPGWDFRGIR